MMDLPGRIRERRRALGLTQDQLADMLHVSRQTVSHWETGRVTPDLENLSQLAEALECSFVIGEKEPEATPDDAVDADDVPAPGDEKSSAPRRQRSLWIALTAAILLIALTAGVLALMRPDAAEIRVTPQDGEAYLIRDSRFESGAGWDVPFYFENVSDVPFRIERLEGRYYEGDSLWATAVVPAELLWPRMSSEWLRKGDFPLCWPFGTDHTQLTRMECTIYGTDENGNALAFTGSVRYLPAQEE